MSALVVLTITLSSAEPGSFHGPLARLARAVLRRIPPGIELDSAQFNFATNIVMFMPLGFFLGLFLKGKKVGAALAAVSMTSAIIESIQFFMPTRGTQFEDILANSVGGWIGIGLAWVLIQLLAQQTDAADRQGSPTG